MDKMKQETADLTQENIARIGELFPNVITEMKDEKGKLKKGINFNLLKQLLSGDVVDGEECYDFTWVGKKASIVEANTPIRKTLRPCIEESKNWETTENLYIEGDNLDVLKLLQESYLNSVKMIYIDPPYNTGNDFIYKDKFIMDEEEYEKKIDLHDEEGNLLFKNTETRGRFHSDWCSMMYPRLKLARSLLAEDGVIFISIDDNEVQNLRKICDEIFGEPNFITQLIWLNKEGGGSSDSKLFRIKHEYVLCYAKNKEKVEINGNEISNRDRYKMKDNHYKERGPFYLQKLAMGTIQYSESLDYPIKTPDGSLIKPADNNGGRKACWRWSEDKLKWGLESDFVVIRKDRKNIWTVYTKQYLKCDNNGITINRTQRPTGIVSDFSSTQASKYMEKLGLGSLFSYSKPMELIRYLSFLTTENSSLVMDFFSGSATTAHAVMQLNAEDGGNRKFIMVQLPEPCDEKSEAFKAGYKNICEIGKERIRRAGDKINKEIEESNKQLKLGEEPKKPVDIGFRVLKVDSTNMKDVFYAPSEYTQKTLTDQISNIKEYRTDLDLLYGVLLEWGLPLSLKHEIEEIDGIKIHIVDNDSLIACFAENISEAVVREIAKRRPLRAVFRDSSFASSSDKINVEEIFKLLAPNTSVKVI